MLTTKLAETQLWQRNLASLVRSGLFTRATLGASHGLSTVIGVYKDGSHSAPLAKYADPRRAQDALDLVNNLVESGLSAETN